MIPIIGQPQLLDLVVTITVKCPCGYTGMLAGRPGAMVACGGDKCTNVFRMNGWPTVTEDGTINMNLGVGKRP